MKQNDHTSGIPVSPALLDVTGEMPNAGDSKSFKQRLLWISALAIAIAGAISFIARALVYLINLVTNLAFFGILSTTYKSPADNHLGWWVIIVPAIGGIIVGLMALYGSKAIRGHGIPEAMEQILVNQSKIRPSITYLKPLSSAIAIGTGGPFGAEGPIIATGGALGSTLGQLFKITSSERKIVLAAGATAGMSAIFGTPIAAVFLAIELLLFEFSPRAILPVALACITGAAGHHLLFESGPVFAMPDLPIPSNIALAIYSSLGLAIGFLSLGTTKIVYWIEDAFEKLPIHWMWWPALGGLAVGLIGFFAPHTLGVGYENISDLLSGKLSIVFILSLLVFKFLSWAIALGSGTSGGTLAPLLTLGGAAGAAIGLLMLRIFPGNGISVPMAALVGMAAMFAGASRAYLTSITFALEATMQSHALLPLLGACTAAYMVSYFLMENTIMTEKIARRGVLTPNAYEPDELLKVTVSDVLSAEAVVFKATDTIQQIRTWLAERQGAENQFAVISDDGYYSGIVSAADVYNTKLAPEASIAGIIKASSVHIHPADNLREAVRLMSNAGVDILPVISADERILLGVLSYRDILKSYQKHYQETEQAGVHLTLKRQQLKILLKGRKLVNRQGSKVR
jgi:CIC family chloride channel protein